MRARLDEKLLPLKPGAITYLTREEWNYMQEQAQRDSILVEREKTHGSFAFQAGVWNKLWDAIPDDVRYQLKLSPAQWLAMNMILVKISRIASGNVKYKDHWDDIAGYAKLGSEACE